MSKAVRQRSARERLAEERRKQALKQKRARALMISVSAVAILALVVGLGVYFANKKEERTQKAAAYSGPLAPVTREADGSIVMAARGTATPLLEVFEDFQCPICREFEQLSGSTIKKLAAQGKVKVVYRPFQLFQQEPLASNTRRAANAALCAPADKWVSYHDTLYKYQPKEGSEGFSVKDLKLWARDLGFDDAAFQKCVSDTQKAGQLGQMTKNALNDRKVTGTPTVFLNGKALNLENQIMNLGAFEAAILAAAKTSPAPSPAPSGSATPNK
jgi:protein-disulfide isomerase